MLSIVTSVGLVLLLSPIAQAPVEGPAPTVEVADLECQGLADEVDPSGAIELDLGLGLPEATPTGGPVPVCALTFCPEVGTRCSNPVADPVRPCCHYTCVADPSCTNPGTPPNVCGKKKPL